MNTASLVTPFGTERRLVMPEGMTIAGLAEAARVTAEYAVCFIRCPAGALQKWQVVPASMWHLIRPKRSDVVRFETYPAGGGAGKVFAAIAAVVIAIAAPYLVASVLPFAVGTFGNALVSTALIVGAQLALQKLIPEPGIAKQKPKSDQADEAFSSVNADSNVLGKDVPPPACHGSVRLSPPDLCNPHKYLENGRDVVTRVVGLSGHHAISDLEFDRVPIDSYPDVTYQIRDGSDTAAKQTLVTKITLTTAIGKDLPGFVHDTDSELVSDQAEPTKSDPQEVIFAPGYHPDMEQITVRLGFNPFIYTKDTLDDSTSIIMPLRIRMREKGETTWINVPEIHIRARTTTALPKEIKFRWDGNFGYVGAADFNYSYWRRVPQAEVDLSDGSTGYQWTANDAFASGTGNTDVKNITAGIDGLNILLDPALIPKGDYEISITAGWPVIERDTDNNLIFNTANYDLDGEVRSLFKARQDGDWFLPYDGDGISASASVDFCVLIANRHPVERPGIAQVALKISNVNAKNLTCVANRYVYDYDAGAETWTTYTTTSNPAPHYRAVLKEWLEFFDVNTALIAEDDFVGWRSECASRGWLVSHISTGGSIMELLDAIATAGFATRRFGFAYGVDYHRDRSADVPEMTFTHRHNKISVSRSFTDRPKGYRITYRDSASGSTETEFFQNNPYSKVSVAENKAFPLMSIPTEELARQRADFDMLQEEYRDKIWTIQSGPDGFGRARGDMIGIVTDLISDHAYGLYIREIIDDTHIAVDQSIPGADGSDLLSIADLLAEEDLLTAGNVTVAHVHEPDGLNEYTITNVSGNIIEFAETIPASWTVGSRTWTRTDMQGARMSIAARTDLYRRCIVLDVKRQSEQRAVITCVDEAPEIEAEMQRKYG